MDRSSTIPESGLPAAMAPDAARATTPPPTAGDADPSSGKDKPPVSASPLNLSSVLAQAADVSAPSLSPEQISRIAANRYAAALKRAVEPGYDTSMHPRHQRDVPGETLWMSDTVTLGRLRLDITGFLGAFLVYSEVRDDFDKSSKWLPPPPAKLPGGTKVEWWAYVKENPGVRSLVTGLIMPNHPAISDCLIATCTICDQLLVVRESLKTDLPKLRRGPCKTGCGYAHSIPSGGPKCCRHCPRAFMMEISDECVLATVADPCD